MTKRTFQILSGNKSSLRAVNSQNIHFACEAATDLWYLYMDVRVTPIDRLLTVHKSAELSIFLHFVANSDVLGLRMGRNGQMEQSISIAPV